MMNRLENASPLISNEFAPALGKDHEAVLFERVRGDAAAVREGDGASSVAVEYFRARRA